MSFIKFLFFASVLTSPAVIGQPLDFPDADDIVDAWKDLLGIEDTSSSSSLAVASVPTPGSPPHAGPDTDPSTSSLPVISSTFIATSAVSNAAPSSSNRVVGSAPSLAPSAVSDVATPSSSLAVASSTLLAPSGVSDAASRLSSVIQAQATESTASGFMSDLAEAGLTTDSVEDALEYVQGLLAGENSSNNYNLRDPSPYAYPLANSEDAPYSVSEYELRSAIYIPDKFQYGEDGAPQPVILVPVRDNPTHTSQTQLKHLSRGPVILATTLSRAATFPSCKVPTLGTLYG
jgi:hypothetical protein